MCAIMLGTTTRAQMASKNHPKTQAVPKRARRQQERGVGSVRVITRGGQYEEQALCQIIFKDEPSATADRVSSVSANSEECKPTMS